jgi:hypothetical protein
MSYLAIEISKYTGRESTEPTEEVEVKATQFKRAVVAQPNVWRGKAEM